MPKSQRKRKPEGICLRLSYDISKSHYQYQSEAVKGMLNKLPLEFMVLPEWFMHMYGQLMIARNAWDKFQREIGESSYEKLIKEALDKDKKNEE